MEDLISRSALLKQFKWNCEGRCQTCVHTTLVGKEELCSLIVDAPAVEQKWIPCSDRLPEDRKEKLVYLSSDRITVAIYNEHRLPHSGKSIGWGYRVPDSYIDFEIETVVAWMPLPEAYGGK